MSNYKNSISGKFISGFVSLTTALWLSGAIMLMPAAIVKAQTTADIQAQIQSLLAQIAQLQSQLATVQGQPAGFSHVFNQNLSFGARNDEVKALQQALDLSGCFNFTSYTGYFGSVTREGVNCFQQKYASEVLTPLGLTSATGFVGAGTRAKLNALYGGVAVVTPTTPTTPTTPVTPTTVVAGAGLAVESGVQPAASLAVESAARVPYTVLKLTAGTSDVTVKSLTVERTGLANDAVFAGIVVLDEDGTQITALAKTLNSVHQAVLNDAFTVKAGTSKTVTVAGNMVASLDAYAGQVAYLSVVALDASGAAVSGNLPITGAGHTINGSLAVGTATLSRGTLDPNTSPTKAVGTTGYTFSSIKITAGSAEDISLEQVRFNQSGSVASGDLTNVKIELDGSSYDPVVSTDGKYYTGKFGAGVTIAKGLTKDVLIKGDIASGSGRTVDFDLYQYQDVVVKGKTYGYYVTPTATAGTDCSGTTSCDDSEFQSINPRYDASQVAVGAGALVVSNSSAVPSGKIANGGLGQPLGAYTFDVTGEPISFTAWSLTVTTTSNAEPGTATFENVTNFTVYNASGTVLAGPQDATSATALAFSNTITLPVGKNVLTVKGNLNTGWDTTDTVALAFTPSTGLSNVLGQTTGQTITPTPSSSVSANSQTVAAGALSVAPSAGFSAQNVIAGSSGVTFGRFVLDATASGEDIRVTSIQARGLTGTNADLDDLNSLALFDGATQLNTGTNVVNPSGNALAADANLTFTLDANALTLSRGTSKVLDLKGNIISTTTPTANTTYIFDFSAGSPDWGVTGVSTGQSISESLATGSANAVTVVTGGTLTASLDSSSPNEQWYAAGSSGVTIGIFKFLGTNEELAVTDLSLQLPNTASSTAADITKLSLYDGTTLVSTKLNPPFTSNREQFTLPTSGAGSFVVPKNTYKLLTVKADLAKISTGESGLAGHLISIATTTTATHHRSLGLQSGAAANILGSASASTGVRNFRSVPKVASVSVSSTNLVVGTNVLYKFSVTADAANDIALQKFTFTIATSNVTVTALKLINKTDGEKIIDQSFAPTATLAEITVDTTEGYSSGWVTVPKGAIHTFELSGTVADAAAGTAGGSVVIQLDGDAAFPSTGTCSTTTSCMISAALVEVDTNDDFIWSDFSSDATSTHALTTADWTNGYKVPGLPTTNLESAVISSSSI